MVYNAFNYKDIKYLVPKTCETFIGPKYLGECDLVACNLSSKGERSMGKILLTNMGSCTILPSGPSD